MPRLARDSLRRVRMTFRTLLLLALLTFIGCTSTVAPPAAAPAPSNADDDPYLWLEDVDGARAMDWVNQQNERTKRELASSPEFDALYRDALAVLNSASRVPVVEYHGAYLYNLWRDAEHPRGLYRRTTVDELHNASPRWTTVLDIDELSRREGKPWVFHGMTCLPPQHRQCLVTLSPGGGDAAEIREFDAESLRFVEGGFFLPVAKTNVAWRDENTLFVATDFGAGSTTESGYARIVKLWKRGTPLSAATTIYEGSPKSVSVSARRYRSGGGVIDLVSEGTTFWNNKYQQLDANGQLQLLALPETAEVVDAFNGRLVVRLQDDWTRGGTTIKAGSVILADPAALRDGVGGSGSVDVLVAPTESEVVEQVEVTDREILVAMLDNVRGRLDRFAPTATGWNRDHVQFPENGAISVMTSHPESGDAMVLFQSFTVPPTLYHVAGGGGAVSSIVSQQATFAGDRFETTQQWATSSDGTRIPYFVVGPKNMKRDGSNRVHIFSYGGFRNSLTPSYSGSYEQLYGAYGRLWLERGGVFVLANIRGGGEFGPAWHSTVLKENRHKVFEDFEAIARDLVATGISRPERIGIEGRSNGGLLTLTTMSRHPELYGAIISGSPLSDMRRYHELLAGASWMAEYGDPRIAQEWEWLRAWSPYQNFRRDAKYPPLFVYASTRDDRVHPGHARKTVARLQEQGHPVWYYENIEGGHGASSTNEQLAYRLALSYVHLWRNVGR
ncbi:MAG TPA: prolyl oligopeptidase family serine peptidase [Thermoanaerobaculia bacterium]|jgi:prolyl oligopeptidase